MKTVTGRVTREKPISLSKAATLLSSFVSSETEASQDVAAYLRRASAAFTELKSFHREIRSTKAKGEHNPSDQLEDKKKSREEDVAEEKVMVKLEEEQGKKERKNKSKKKKGEEDVVDEKVDVRLEEEQRNEESKEKKRKKNRGEEDVVEENVNEERKEKKKKKKKKRKSDGGEIGSEERKSKKKRKSKEIDA